MRNLPKKCKRVAEEMRNLPKKYEIAAEEMQKSCCGNAKELL